jgi:hypothetical protein
MNDFVAKPVDPEILYATLLKWLPSQVPQEIAIHGRSAADDAEWERRLAVVPGLDVASGLRMTGGKMSTSRRLLGVWVRNQRPEIQRLAGLSAAGRLA